MLTGFLNGELWKDPLARKIIAALFDEAYPLVQSRVPHLTRVALAEHMENAMRKSPDIKIVCLSKQFVD